MKKIAYLKRISGLLCMVMLLTFISGCAFDSNKTDSKTDSKADSKADSSTTKSESHDYAAEVQTMEIVSRHWDAIEIEERFKDFTTNIAERKGINDFLADELAEENKERIVSYFGQFEGNTISYVYTSFQTFYKVEAADDYNDLRGTLEYKFRVNKDGKSMEYTVLLNMARLGDADGVAWKIYDIMWKDNGIDVSDIELIQLEKPRAGEEVCVMKTDAGIIKMRLFPEQAPKAVENWIGLAKEGFYDGYPFGRVIKEFVIQGGALDGSGEESKSIYDGFYEDEVQRGLFNFNGALCLGNNGPHTNGNQFFIVQNTSADIELLPRLSLPLNVEEKYKEIGGVPELDGRYTVFGQVYEGMDVVINIANQETDAEDAPIANPVKIISVEFEII